MKTIIIIVLAVIVGLVILGGGLGTFLSNVEEGTEKLKQNEKFQEVQEQVSSKIASEVKQFDNIIKNPIPKDSPVDPKTILVPKEITSQSSSQNCTGTARCIRGFVTEVIDGDTITVDGQSIRFALASAPELSEFGGIEAKDFIDSICPVGSTVLVDEDDGQTEGSYNRTIGVIYCNGKNLNEELVESDHGYLSSVFCSKSEFSSESWAKKFGC